MALLTKAQVRDAVAQAIDDPDFKRWGKGALDSLISLVQDTMWEAILDVFEHFNSQSDTIALSSGNQAISGLTKRFYRIQQITIAGVEIHAKMFTEVWDESVQSYYILGGNIVTHPSQGSASMTTIYSFLPTKFQDLASDITVLDTWPEGHEAALIYASAAWAMTKGDQEQMQQIARLADVSLTAMLNHIARRFPVPADYSVAQIKAAVLVGPTILPASQ